MADGALQPPSPLLPEEEHFEILLSFGRADAALFEREYLERRGSWVPVVAVVGALFIIVGAIAASDAISRWLGLESWSPLVGAIAAGIGAWVFVHAVYVAVKVLGGKEEPVPTDGGVLVTTLGGLWLVTQHDDGIRPWTDFKEMIVSNDAIYLGLDGRRAIMLPARVFDDRNDFHTFVSVMSKYARV